LHPSPFNEPLAPFCAGLHGIPPQLLVACDFWKFAIGQPNKFSGTFEPMLIGIAAMAFRINIVSCLKKVMAPCAVKLALK
jgi:hypothetical protein